MIKKKSDEEILFPEAKVAGKVIKPWSFGALFDLSESLEIVLDKVEEKGIDKEFESNSGIMPYTTIARLFTIANKEVLKIIAYTLGEDEVEVKKLSMVDGVKITMIIFNQNKETIKNALIPLLAEAQEDLGDEDEDEGEEKVEEKQE